MYSKLLVIEIKSNYMNLNQKKTKKRGSIDENRSHRYLNLFKFIQNR
jgi:hypothetical protein